MTAAESRAPTLWEQHLARVNAELQRENKQLRSRVNYQKHRAEQWKLRALKKPKR